MRRKLSLGLALALGMALTGCGGGSGSSGNTPLTRSVSRTLADHLTLTLAEDTTQAAVNGVVNYQVTLTNPTSAPITSTYQGSSGSIFADYPGSLQVRNSQGAPVNTDGGQVFPLPVTAPMDITVTLQPGETLTTAGQYTFIRADTYTATATLTPTVGAFEQTGSVAVRVR